MRLPHNKTVVQRFCCGRTDMKNIMGGVAEGGLFWPRKRATAYLEQAIAEPWQFDYAPLCRVRSR
jgi:hypothetical protein